MNINEQISTFLFALHAIFICASPKVAKLFRVGVSDKRLHLECLYSMALELWPDATKWYDRDAWQQLKCSSTIASTVLKAYPEAAAIADSSEERFPCYIAALRGANGTLLQHMYNRYPNAIKARTKSFYGRIFLHSAWHKDTNPGAVRVLLEYYPEAAKIGGKKCCSPPLHVALRNGCDAVILNKLLPEAYPQALETKNAKSGAGCLSLGVCFLMLMGLFATTLSTIGLNLGWVPLWGMMTWAKASGKVAAWAGFIFATISWLIRAQIKSEKITVDTLRTNKVMLSGNLVAILSSTFAHYVYSKFVDDRINLAEEDLSGLSAKQSNTVMIHHTKRWILIRHGYFLAFLLVLLWPKADVIIYAADSNVTAYSKPGSDHLFLRVNQAHDWKSLRSATDLASFKNETANDEKKQVVTIVQATIPQKQPSQHQEQMKTKHQKDKASKSAIKHQKAKTSKQLKEKEIKPQKPWKTKHQKDKASKSAIKHQKAKTSKQLKEKENKPQKPCDTSSISVSNSHKKSCISVGEKICQTNSEATMMSFGVTEDKQLNLLDSYENVLWTFGSEVTRICLSLDASSQSTEKNEGAITRTGKHQKKKNSSHGWKQTQCITPQLTIYDGDDIIGQVVCDVPDSRKATLLSFEGKKKQMIELQLKMPKIKGVFTDSPITVVKLNLNKHDDLVAIKVQTDPAGVGGYVSCLEIHPSCEADLPVELVASCDEYSQYTKGLEYFFGSEGIDSFNKHRDDARTWYKDYVWPIVLQKNDELGQEPPEDFEDFFDTFVNNYFLGIPYLNASLVLEMVNNEIQGSGLQHDHSSRELVYYNNNDFPGKSISSESIASFLTQTRGLLSADCILEIVQLSINVISLVMGTIIPVSKEILAPIIKKLLKINAKGIPRLIPKDILVPQSFDKDFFTKWAVTLTVQWVTSITFESVVKMVKDTLFNMSVTGILEVLVRLSTIVASPPFAIAALIAKVLVDLLQVYSSAYDVISECVSCDDSNLCTADYPTDHYTLFSHRCKHIPDPKITCPVNFSCNPKDGLCYSLGCDTRRKPNCDDGYRCSTDLAVCNTTTLEWECTYYPGICPFNGECSSQFGCPVISSVCMAPVTFEDAPFESVGTLSFLATYGEITTITGYNWDNSSSRDAFKIFHYFNGNFVYDETFEYDAYGQVSYGPLSGWYIFGTVAVSNNIIALGNLMSKSVYVYEKVSGLWRHTDSIVPVNIDDSTLFGYTISIDGDVMAIGAPYDRDLKGSVFVYRRNKSTWVLEQKLEPFETQPPSGYEGIDYPPLSVKGNLLAVGDPYNNDGKGAVFIYEYDSFSWNLLGVPLRNCEGQFGASVVFTPFRECLIGCPGYNDQTGAVLFYKQASAGSLFVLEEFIEPSDVEQRDGLQFGKQIAVYHYGMAVGSSKGKAYIFYHWDNLLWTLAANINVADVSELSTYVGMTGNTVLIASSGNVYSYVLEECTTTTTTTPEPITTPTSPCVSSVGFVQNFFDDGTYSILCDYNGVEECDYHLVAVFGDTAVVAWNFETIKFLSKVDGIFETTSTLDIDYSAYVIAMSGNYVFVGEYPDDESIVHVYERGLSRMWNPTDSIVPNDNTLRFGNSINIDGDVMVVGGDSNEYYVFRHRGSAWVEETQLIPSIPSSARFTHHAASVRGGLVAVADCYSDEDCVGAVFVYAFNSLSNSWLVTDTILNHDCTRGWFGMSGLAFTSSGGLLIGCYIGNSYDGAVYYYKQLESEGHFAFQQKISITSRAHPDSRWYWGHHTKMSVDGNILVVGTGVWNENQKVYLFELVGDTWTEVYIIPPPSFRDNYFGLYTSVSRNKNNGYDILVSSVYNAYYYRFDECNTTTTSTTTPTLPVTCNTNGRCEHGETFENCPEDCPNPPYRWPKLPSDPEIFDYDFLELVNRSMFLSDIVHYKSTSSIIEFSDDFWVYPPDSTDDNVADAALVSREYNMGRCIIALRGTNFAMNFGSLKDIWQVANPRIRWVFEAREQRSRGCRVREGWAQAFFGNKQALLGDTLEPIDGHYGPKLQERIQNCLDDNLRLVFTGHSQGGALALVGHLAYNLYDPISITFAAPPTFVTETTGADPCPAVRNDQIYRFINTEHDEIALNYDTVPFIGEALTQVLELAAPLQDSVFKEIFGFLPSTLGLTLSELKRRTGTHKGPVALLSPEVDSNIKVYIDQDAVGEPKLWMFDILDIGQDVFFSAHLRPSYKEKVRHLLEAMTKGGEIGTTGFSSDRQCNYPKECAGQKCEAPIGNTCLTPLSDNTYDCEDDNDCVSKRCNFNSFGYEICEPKLDNGKDCWFDNDCKSSHCMKDDLFSSSYCGAKIENGSPCIVDHRCISGRCDGVCKAVITDVGLSYCFDDTDCLTGRCIENFFGMGKCASKLSDGEKCERAADCSVESWCDNKTCKKKKILRESCEDHGECASDRCSIPARKVCT